MKTLFIAFLLGSVVFCLPVIFGQAVIKNRLLSAGDIKPVEPPEEVDVDNIKKHKRAVASKLDPAEVYKDLGASYLEQGKLDKAIVEFKKAVQVDSRFVEAHYLLADVYSIKGEGALSRKSLETAMALEGSYIIDTMIGIVDETHKIKIIESAPSPVMEFEELIKRTFPPEFFEDPDKIGVPRRWKSPPK